MTTLVFRNQEQLNVEQVVEKFSEAVNDCKSFSQDEIDLLAETYAKNPVDKFIIHEQPTDLVAQGDILFFAKGTPSYETFRPLVKRLKNTDRLVLQEGDSLTGDHRLVPLEGSDFTLQVGTFVPPVLRDKSQWNSAPEWECRLLNIDKPFLVFHREHGNIALPAGEYMICSSLDSSASTFTRMMD